jgi:putative flippase GtrA
MAMPPRIREVLTFLTVGGLSAAIDAGGFLLLSWLGVPPVLASAIGFMSAFVVNYGGNRRIVFRTAARGSLWRYVTLVIVNLGLSAGLVALGIALGLVPVAAKAVSIVVIAAFNYAVMRLWVFRVRSPRPHDSESPSTEGD